MPSIGLDDCDICQTDSHVVASPTSTALVGRLGSGEERHEEPRCRHRAADLCQEGGMKRAEVLIDRPKAKAAVSNDNSDAPR